MEISFEEIYEALYDQDIHEDVDTLSKNTGIISPHVWFDKD